MDDGFGKIEVYKDHFEASVPSEQTPNSENYPKSPCSLRSHSRFWPRRQVSAASMLRLFSLPHLPWVPSNDGDDKVEMSIAEVESLRSEIADAEEREAYLKAQLEQIDGTLKSANLAGYLQVRTRWIELPGEPPIIDDNDVDDWLPRFVVLHGSCIFYYFQSTDLSPQDTTLLSDIVEVGPLLSFTREDQKTYNAFYILTCHGLRFECSSTSKIQVDSWLNALQIECNSRPNASSKISSES